MLHCFRPGGDATGTWYEPVLDLFRSAPEGAPETADGRVDHIEPRPGGACVVCDEDDHCLPRWEDDGGRMASAVLREGEGRRRIG